MVDVKASVNVKINKSVKETAAQLLENMGLDQTTAIDMFYRQIIRDQGFPFRPTAELSLDEQIVAAIKKRNAPHIRLECDENGNILIDKEKDPELFDWAVNG